MIKELKAVDLADPIRKAVTGAYFIKGNKDVSNVDLKAIVEYVAKTLKESFSTYRIPEVCQAIELGARGELYKENDMNVVSPENIFKWIHRYNELIRKEVIHKQKQYEEKQAKILEETARQAKNQEFEEEIIKTFENFPESFKNRSKGELAAHYRQLDKMGLIRMTTPVKKEIFNQILKIKDRTKWANKGMLEITAKELAEYRALRITFKGWKEMEIDLREEIKQAKQ